jgi:hypothetical protein
MPPSEAELQNLKRNATGEPEAHRNVLRQRRYRLPRRSAYRQ